MPNPNGSRPLEDFLWIGAPGSWPTLEDFCIEVSKGQVGPHGRNVGKVRKMQNVFLDLIAYTQRRSKKSKDLRDQERANHSRWA